MTVVRPTVPDAGCLGTTIVRGLLAAGVSARLRSGDDVVWKEISSRLEYMPVDYSLAMIDYQSAYWLGVGFPTEDFSLILAHDSRPCGIWPLSVKRDAAGKISIGSNGAAVLPPLFVPGLARKTVKSVTSACLTELEAICRLVGQACIESVELYTGADGLGDWHDRLMQGGARVDLRHDLFLDLLPSMAEIKSTFRKSYKALITSGSKLWRVRLVTTSDILLWDEFRLLHLAVAGRATRSEDSWRAQHDAIVSGDAFFVSLRDQQGALVGGGLFHTTAHEGLYAIGAYDRSLFDKPLGHVVQYCAIEEMKRRGIRWYRLGARCYPSDVPVPSEKELTISNFKQGFASHIFPRYWIRYEPKHG